MTKPLLGSFVMMIVVCQVLVGCAPSAKYKPYEKDELLSLNTKSRERKLAKGIVIESNSSQREPDNLPFSAEKEWYRPPIGDRPQKCIALSGGGMRSASFSIGILAELSKAGELEKTDIMSSVSGGGYALSWFYMQHYNAADGGRKVLQPEERARIQTAMFERPSPSDDGSGPPNHQAYLRTRSRFFTEWDYTQNALGNIPLMPFHLVVNGLFSWRIRIGLPSWSYERRIIDVFFKSPDRDTISVPTIYELGQFAQRSGLPAFMFNTTAWIGTVWGNPKPSELTLSDSVFSFTPLQYGSGGYGLYRYPDDPTVNKKYDDLTPLRISEVIATSGAALDFSSMVDDRIATWTLSVLADDFGRYISNPAVGLGARWFHRILPIPLYFGSRFANDLTGVGIYLSDGGHLENLAVYPLVIRGCKHITVVDAEQDPHYEFGGYFLLQRKLKAELQLELYVEDIQKGLDLAKIEAKLAQNETQLFDYGKSEINDPSTGTRWKRYAENPIMDGEIKNFPGGDIHITYVKLAYRPPSQSQPKVNENAMAEPYYGSWWIPWLKECNRFSDDPIVDYYYCIKQERVQKWLYLDTKDPFPQQPTSSQNFSPDQFNAYVELGRTIGQQLASELKKTQGQ